MDKYVIDLYKAPTLERDKVPSAKGDTVFCSTMYICQLPTHAGDCVSALCVENES